MINFRNYQIVIEFKAPAIPKALFWFINRALENELKYFGHLTDIVIGNPIASIEEVSWQTTHIPMGEGENLEIGEFEACTF